MRSPRNAVQGIQWVQPRDQTVPAVCYDGCNNAYFEAQAIGMTPEVCDSFSGYCKACRDCLEAYDTNSEATKDYLDSTFGQWINYCEAGSAIPMTGTPSVSIPSSTPSLIEQTVVVTILYTATVDGVTTIWPLEMTVTSFAPIPDTTVITIDTSQDGHRTIWTFTKTYAHLSSDALISPLQNTSSSAVTQNISTSTPRTSEVTAESESTQSNRAWVAGPVIGGVTGIVILLLVAWVLFRAKRNRERKRKGHELHGESSLKSELEVKLDPQELDGQEQSRQPVELPSSTS
ncbi:hypothetical protein F4782DRAFT_521964 [Xylaria castorea]|nr:hypothetical protein F4782DRAFT_521964 [Xylaria castorea]